MANGFERIKRLTGRHTTKMAQDAPLTETLRTAGEKGTGITQKPTVTFFPQCKRSYRTRLTV